MPALALSRCPLHGLLVALAAGAPLALLCGCHGRGAASTDSPAPPPDARRPVIRSEAELAAERAARIRSGQTVPTSVPADPAAARPSPAAPIRPLQVVPGAIEADILMVNDQALTVAEVLYPLHDRILAAHREQTQAGFRERVRQMVREETQRAVGGLLIYAEATSSLDEDQRTALDKTVDRDIADRTAREFGGSSARLAAHLKDCGLTLDQFRAAVRRELVVRQYTRDKLMPQVQIRRDELLEAYRRNASRYETTETRELLLIELPYAKFLPPGRDWSTAAPADRAAARLAALEAARSAHAALAAGQPFADVAREYSRGVHAAEGGSWGSIGKPLQPPYDEVSRRIFACQSGQYSEPLETELGWFIVQCGEIHPATHRTFLDVQDELRRELAERRFLKLSIDYVLRLAERATVSSLDQFISAAVRRAERQAVRAEARAAGA